MTTRSKLPFTKMTGTGNDFIIIDGRAGFSEADRPGLARRLCRRSFGIGADGLVIIENPVSKDAHFKWDFYNADGSVAEMCGNASRCVARYAFEKKIAPQSLQFETLAGLVKARVLEGQVVEVDVPAPKILDVNCEVLVGEHIKINVMVVDSGVPHAVKENDDWDQEYLFEMGQFLRKHEKFKKYGGANGTFYEVIGKSSLQSATYERGVEDVTLACGTGALAAAAAAFEKKQVESPVDVRVPGGILEVKLTPTGATLIGEAQFVFEGEAFLEEIL